MAKYSPKSKYQGRVFILTFTISFATNASMFRVKLQTDKKQQEGETEYKESIDIMKDDVDIYGVLKSGSDKAGTFLEHFQDAYELRFQNTTFEFQFY